MFNVLQLIMNDSEMLFQFYLNYFIPVPALYSFLKWPADSFWHVQPEQWPITTDVNRNTNQ